MAARGLQTTDPEDHSETLIHTGVDEGLDEGLGLSRPKHLELLQNLSQHQSPVKHGLGSVMVWDCSIDNHDPNSSRSMSEGAIRLRLSNLLDSDFAKFKVFQLSSAAQKKAFLFYSGSPMRHKNEWKKVDLNIRFQAGVSAAPQENTASFLSVDKN